MSRAEGSEDDLVWPDPDDVGVLLQALISRLRSLGGASYAEDVAADSLVAMAAALADGRLDQGSNPPGYLMTIARNRLEDARRSARRETARMRLVTPVEAALAAEDPIGVMLDELASVELLHQALKQADPVAVRVATAFRDLAAIKSERPTAREVAAAANVSRKTVFAALKRLETLLQQLEAESG